MNNPEVSEDNKSVARLTAAAFGGNCKVLSYFDSKEETKIGILHAVDRPNDGLTAFGTIGLSDYAIPGSTASPPLGSEITACSVHEEFANVLSSAAFYVINDGWIAEPGRVFGGIVSVYFEDATTPHLYLVNPPWVWPELRARELAHKTVGWLMGIPITDEERRYISSHGSDAFETLLEENDPDFIDLWRDSIV